MEEISCLRGVSEKLLASSKHCFATEIKNCSGNRKK